MDNLISSNNNFNNGYLLFLRLNRFILSNRMQVLIVIKILTLHQLERQILIMMKVIINS